MIDTTSRTWAAVRDLVEKQLELSRGLVEMEGLENSTTQYHRGQIALAKEILSLAEKS